MQFILFIATDASPDPGAEAPGEVDAWVEEGERRGIRKLGDPFRPISEAKTVRVRGGELMVTDGAFAGADARIVGFDLVECDSLDDAVDYASRHPMARFGRVDVRELWSMD